MKIEWKNYCTNYPCGQFVVTAENEQDRGILRAFLAAGEYMKQPPKFVLHGQTHTGNVGITSFNFGYRMPKQEDEESP
jgi:hypothetical protein